MPQTELMPKGQAMPTHRGVIQRLFEQQKGVCPWCGYTMLMSDIPTSHRDVDATVDHLSPFVDGRTRPTRFKVAAHRKCNNSRGHDPIVREEIKLQIRKSAVHCGLTRNQTVANHIWSQKILQAFRVNGIDIRSPFTKKSLF